MWSLRHSRQTHNWFLGRSAVKLCVGVLAVQGAVSEHMDALREAAREAKMDVEVVTVRTREDLQGVHGIVVPGGESTTISRLLRSSGIQEPLQERARSGDLAVFGTCAGMILLAKEASHDVADKDIELLGLLEAEVNRNAFGRQRESFETILDVEGIGAMPAVFIRAPALTKVWGQTEVLSRIGDDVVVAQRGNILASAFHSELTPDRRLHRRFLEMASDAAGRSG